MKKRFLALVLVLLLLLTTSCSKNTVVEVENTETKPSVLDESMVIDDESKEINSILNREILFCAKEVFPKEHIEVLKGLVPGADTLKFKDILNDENFINATWKTLEVSSEIKGYAFFGTLITNASDIGFLFLTIDGIDIAIFSNLQVGYSEDGSFGVDDYLKDHSAIESLILSDASNSLSAICMVENVLEEMSVYINESSNISVSKNDVKEKFGNDFISDYQVESYVSHNHVWSSNWIPVDYGDCHCKTCDCGELIYENHQYDNGNIIKDATHTSDGVVVYTCTICEATKREVIPKTTSHQYGEWEADWNEKEHKRYCSCGHYEKEYHRFDSGIITKKATHTALGVRVYTCTECGYNKEEKIPMTFEHRWGNWQQYSTNSHIRYCDCGKSEQESHNLKYDSYNSTGSVSVYRCVCGYTEKEESYEETESKYVPEVEKEPETTKYHYSCYYARYIVSENHTGTYYAESASQVESGIASEGGTIDGSIQYYEVTTNEYKGEYFQTESGIWVYLD